MIDRSGTVVHLSGQRIDRWHLTPIGANCWALVDVDIDAIIGQLYLDAAHGPGGRSTYRCTAYRRSWLTPDAPFVAVCPAHAAPCGPWAFGEAMALLRRSLADAPTHLEVG